MTTTLPTVGIEEEYQLVDPESGELIPRCKEVMQSLRRRSSQQIAEASIQHELHLNQIEMASEVCESLADVRQTLVATRGTLAQAAADNGCQLAAAGTNPMAIPQDQTLTPKDRYLSMRQRYQQIARELFIFGCHVHVAMEDRQLGVQVMNRCRRWLPLLQAVTSNSPFWDGEDTGYASFRRELWAQWPMAGPPPHFDDFEDYQSCVDQLTKVGAIKDETYIYWDIRLPTKVPTIEFRGADVLTRVDEAVGYTGLVRAMVMTATEEAKQGKPCTAIRPSVMSYALWHSARFGVSDQLVDLDSCQKIPAADEVDRVMDQLDRSLCQSGERDAVESFITGALQGGTGADRQRKNQSLVDVVRQVVSETKPGVPVPNTPATKQPC